ncbi:hypothetical protein BDN70DRAFT_922006 [Pholiota conissans]|uniref:Uncharacterized protein n=1 Tax=Pholiota conissans TaxID=109636 RepID=A0A9P5YZ53_9AGAR|nr:hypothetical protein BDN70DRAFT_922006 [Pholiota conissans]
MYGTMIKRMTSSGPKLVFKAQQRSWRLFPDIGIPDLILPIPFLAAPRDTLINTSEIVGLIIPPHPNFSLPLPPPLPLANTLLRQAAALQAYSPQDTKPGTVINVMDRVTRLQHTGNRMCTLHRQAAGIIIRNEKTNSKVAQISLSRSCGTAIACIREEQSAFGLEAADGL